VQLHKNIGEHYNDWVNQVVDIETEDDDYDGVFCPGDEDAAGAVEELHDALKARSLISYELFNREKKARTTRTLATTRKKLRAVK
jgi:hypothetical protein